MEIEESLREEVIYVTDHGEQRHKNSPQILFEVLPDLVR